MKAIFIMMLFIFSSGSMACANRTVYVKIKPSSFEALKHQFMIFSHLPYEVTEVKKESKHTLVAISYRGEGPNSLELGESVRKTLEPRYGEFGITGIRAEFDPTLRCR